MSSCASVLLHKSEKSSSDVRDSMSWALREVLLSATIVRSSQVGERLRECLEPGLDAWKRSLEVVIYSVRDIL
jgi:hypothetical protein